MAIFLSGRGAHVSGSSEIWLVLNEQILGLEVCKDTLIGDEMRRGISGGQTKRVTIGMFLLTRRFLQCF